MVTLQNRDTRLLAVVAIAALAILMTVAVAAGADAAPEQERLINIEVRDMAVGDVLRMLGQHAGVNIIVGKGVTGEIQSLTLRDVPVEDALRHISEANGLYWRKDGNVYIVTSEPPTTLRPTAVPTARQEPEGAAGQPPDDSTAASVPPPPQPTTYGTNPPADVSQPKIITEMIQLSHASARDIAALFGGHTAGNTGLLRSSRGMLSPQMASNNSGIGGMSAYSSTALGGRRPVGLAQFGDDIGGGDIGGGFGGGFTGGADTGRTGTGTTGGGGGTITLPGEMEEPVAILAHNALLVRGTREEIDQFREMLQLLDMPQKQVEIATKWIDVSTTASKALGIDWAVTNGALEIFNLGFAPGEAANNGIRYGRGRWFAELAVLENNSQATVINEPRVTCMNGQPGIIAFETEIPYFAATISYNQFGQRTVDFTSEFVNVSNELWVVPQINPDDSIKMQLSPQLEDQVGTVEGPNGERIPIVTTQYVDTMVRVKNGETIVLGGVIRRDESVNLRRTPLLSEIPIIGKLFESRRTEANDTELLIFVTPQIVRDGAADY